VQKQLTHWPLTLGTVIVVSVACSDASAPITRHRAEDVPLRNIVVNGPQDVPLEDGDSMPQAFLNTAPLIQNTKLDSDFAPTFAYATATMQYFASHAKLEVSLKLKRGTDVIDSASGAASDDNLIPLSSTLYAPSNVSLSAKCGLRLDAKAQYSAWMAFPIPKTGTLFSWGHTSQSLSKPSAQPDCPPAPPGGGSTSGDDFWTPLWEDPEIWQDDDDESPYIGSCGLYQLWIATINGIVVDSWWEWTEVDDAYCASINMMYQ
jgi:hypothetical protein